MIVGIDASNLKVGGGKTHLYEILTNLNTKAHKIEKIVIWGQKANIKNLKDIPLVKLKTPLQLEKNLLVRIFWQLFILQKDIKKENCDILFSPGGLFTGKFNPVIVMCRNMLPFEWKELKRFGISSVTIRLILLRIFQMLSFKKSNGIIFLTTYAHNIISKKITLKNSKIKIIPHGVNKNFFKKPRIQKHIGDYTISNPFKILYVSIIDIYKHQWNLVEAVSILRIKNNWPLTLHLVGPYSKPSLRKLQNSIEKFDNDKLWVNYHGSIEYNKLNKIYFSSNLGVFASSCENMPNILLETMASGLPVVSSNKGVMLEILKDFGLYFDPECPKSISVALEKMIISPDLRRKYSNLSYHEAKKYSWSKSSKETFNFLQKIAKSKRDK